MRVFRLDEKTGLLHEVDPATPGRASQTILECRILFTQAENEARDAEEAAHKAELEAEQAAAAEARAAEEAEALAAEAKLSPKEKLAARLGMTVEELRSALDG